MVDQNCSTGPTRQQPISTNGTLCPKSEPAAVKSLPSTIVFAAVFLLVAMGIGVLSIGTQQTTGPSATETTGAHFETPVAPNFFINGGPEVGEMCFEIPLSSPAVLNVTATFPWSGYSSLSLVQHFVPIDYSFESFPLAGAVPRWLTLSMQPSYVTIQETAKAQSNMYIDIDAPVSSGTQGSIAIDAAFVDPVSGVSSVHVIVLTLHVNSALTTASPC